MNPNQERIEAVFETARRLPSGAERAAYLDRACGADRELRRQIEAMLATEAAADQYFRTADVPGEAVREVALNTPVGPSEPLTEGPGTFIGRYKLLQQIGEGGFGVVYMAEQREPVERKVALKVIKLGMDTKQVVARFEAERQALALMDHPHIAKVYDAGVIGVPASGDLTSDLGLPTSGSGRPYFVMELVHGVPITAYCDRNNLPPAERLELFIPVCQAIQHAHQKGIIHRDIKPSNVLVTLNDGVSHPMVIDFGVAKALNQRLTEKTLFTDFGQMIGTPAYMSPEQAEMSKLDVDTRSDVYSLGVLLYELLTGTTPFPEQRLRGAGWAEMQRIIAEEEPPRPSTRLSALTEAERTGIAQHRQTDARRLTFLVRGDLDWIVMKALEKDRTRRYETANGLAMDIERYLNDEPVLAVAPSARYRIVKFVRRHRAGLAVTAALFGMLVAGVIVSSWQMVRARQAEKEAVAMRGQAEAVSEFLVEAFRSPDPEQDGRKVTVAEVLDRARTNLVGRFEGAPERKAALLLALGETYLGLGLYSAAEGSLIESLKLWQEGPGAVDAERLRCRQTLSTLYQLQDRLDEAEKLAQESLDLSRQGFGSEHTNTLAAMQRLAEVYLARERSRPAKDLLTKSVAILKRTLGPDDPQTLRATLALAEAYKFSDESGEAEALYRDTVERMRRVLPPGHPRLMQALTSLGHLYRNDFRRSSEAERLFREALAIGDPVLGPEHPETLLVLNNVAFACEGSGKLSEAEQLYGRAFEFLRRVLGPEHSKTLALMENLATINRKLGRFPKSERFSLDLLAIQRRILGPEAAGTLRTMNRLGLILFEQGRLSEAEQLLNETLSLQRRVVGIESQDTLSSMSHLGNVYVGQGRFAEAEKLLEELRDTHCRTLGAEHRETLIDRHNLATVYARQNRLAEAERLHHDTLSILRRVQGPTHPDTFSSMNGLAVVHARQGRLAEAATLFEELLPLRRQAQGTEHPETLVTWFNLAHVCARLNRLEEAEQLQKGVLELRSRLLGNDHEHTLESLSELAYIHEQQGRFADSEARYAEALKTRRSLTNASLGAIRQLAAKLSQVLYQQSKFDQIESLQHELLAYCRNREPTDLVRIAGVLDELIMTLLEAEKFKEAEPLARECLALREREKPDDWLTVGTRCRVAASLIGQGRFAEAEPILRSAYDFLEGRRADLPRAGRTRLAETRLLLARVYAATDRTDAIARLRGENLEELRLPSRPPSATLRQLDLSLFYNAALTNDWRGGASTNGQSSFAALPQGLQEFAGTAFDVRGIVQLARGPQPDADRDFARAVERIPVRQSARRLHFLHACSWGVLWHAHVESSGRRSVVEAGARGTLIGRYVVHYADGQRRTIPVRLGREVAEWWHWPESPPDPEELTVAWTGTNAAAARENAQMRLFKTSWDNPLPEVEIRSLDYISAMATPAPFLIAVTAE